MYKPVLGDVIKHNGKAMVVVDININEDAGSCAYDRTYMLCDYDYLKQNQGIITLDDIKKHNTSIQIGGIHFPQFIKMDDAIPFVIERVNCYGVRQKTANQSNISNCQRP